MFLLLAVVYILFYLFILFVCLLFCLLACVIFLKGGKVGSVVAKESFMSYINLTKWMKISATSF